MPTGSPCKHADIQVEPSAYAGVAGFQRPSADRRLAATTRSGRNPLAGKGMGSKTLEAEVARATKELAVAFPGPLILPDDHLAIDPKDPPQSFRSWLLEGDRNKPTKTRSTLYVAPVPEITAQMRHMKSWLEPKIVSGQKGKKTKNVASTMQPLRAEDFVQYLSAFYHGMTVKPLPGPLKFVPWAGKSAVGQEKYVGFATSQNCTRIRARPSPDNLFGGQLNLEDILDAAIEMLPDDAYALVLLTDHDLYEDEDDDFCCGRAYGGSRVCVVSSARYHPMLDDFEGIDYHHMWPMSHCKAYVNNACREEGVDAVEEAQTSQPPQSYLHHAIDAAKLCKLDIDLEAQRGLLFSRLVRTVAHELGHCFGMEHCNYYACAMQGTAGMAEDLRQPPYLCPVCLGKVAYAVAWELQGGKEEQKQVYVKERYEDMVKFCDMWKHVGLFAGYGAWLQARLGSL